MEQILIVDDNEDILEFLEDDLSERYKVFTAKAVSEAYTILQQTTTNLIISDVMMPETDGFEFCHALKNNIDYSHIPVILLTAKNSIQSKIEGLHCGADAYVEKPFLIEYLNAQIESLLKNRKKIREHFATQPLTQLVTVANNDADKEFLQKLNNIIENNMDDPELDVDKLSYLLAVSRTSLYRKIKALTGIGANEIINLTRLKKAVQLMATGKFNLSEIVVIIGYSSLNQLGRNFQKQFGIAPKTYMQQLFKNKPPQNS